jgi:hypothetical protein
MVVRFKDDPQVDALCIPGGFFAEVRKIFRNFVKFFCLVCFHLRISYKMFYHNFFTLVAMVIIVLGLWIGFPKLFVNFLYLTNVMCGQFLFKVYSLSLDLQYCLWCHNIGFKLSLLRISNSKAHKACFELRFYP